VVYSLNIDEALVSKVNRQYLTFIEDCKEELEAVKDLKEGEYVGGYSKNQRNG